VRARLRFATGIDVPLAEIVAARTVRDLAAAVEDRLVN
jgi:hypothetical protein